MKPSALAAPAALLVAFACPIALAQDGAGFDWGERNTDFPPAFDEQFRAPIVASDAVLDTRVLADGLDVPWGVAELPGGAGLLISERGGTLRHLTLDGTLSEPISGVPEVLAENQGGLLDVALGPDFATDRSVYLTYAKPLGDGMNATAAARGTLTEDLSALEGVEDIFVQDPPSSNPMHYGSRIAFDDEGHVFVTTGEHYSLEERDYAQDDDKEYGKIIRLGLDGSIPDDNPFVGDAGAKGSVWSLGHRNVQGAAIDADGTLWTIEHGPAGGDELNRPESGRNYGWPIVSYGRRYSGEPIGIGEASADGFEQPVYFWDPVIAPTGMDFHAGETFADWNGDLLIGGLIALAVVRLDIGDDGRVRGEERLLQGIGRVRDVEVLDDGSFVVLLGRGDNSVVHVTPGG